MPCKRYILYLTWNRHKYRIGISANPHIDLSFLRNQEEYEHMAYLSPPLPLALSEYLMNVVSSSQERIGKPYREYLKVPLYKKSFFIQSILRKKYRQVKKELARFGEDYVMVSEPIITNSAGVNIDYFTLHHNEDILESILQGHILYLHEITRRLKESNLMIEDLEVILHLLTLKGQVVRVPSVSFSPQGRTCNRCGHQYKVVKVYCEKGKKECYYCQECLMLGESKPCDALYAIPARTRPDENFVRSVRLNLDITFSLAQYEAFESLARFVRKDSLSECLTWEACGAGRPEVVFGAVREVLKRGGRVLFGVPRKDILEDLVLRLERAFPGVNVDTRYGKARSHRRGSDIILASAHQAMKYYKNFDLVILDESDAFPYRANPILINALRRAKKNDGKLIYLTPTPAPSVYSRVQRGEVKLVMIPVRHHGYPLSVPKVVAESQLIADNKVSETIFQLVRESLEEDQAPILIIVPDSNYSQIIGPWLEERLKGLNWPVLKEKPVVYTSSRDPNRDRTVAAYFRGDHNILVTTSLTSRGDRAPNSHVIVVGADNEIFDEGCLIQLASRIGWSDAYPNGKVWFVTTKVTRDIESAIRKIKLLNEEAHKRGFLDQAKPKKNTVKF
ncbi:MAG: DEAD/DEAH box helicase family protein [Chitinophagales bacterium]